MTAQYCLFKNATIRRGGGETEAPTPRHDPLQGILHYRIIPFNILETQSTFLSERG